MTKQDFLTQLRKGLRGMPEHDLEERVTFYSEMIDDRMEEGLSEKEAVSAIGSVDSIIAQIVREVPMTKLIKEKIAPRRRLKAWEITLLILGSPIWLSLLIAAAAVVLALYVCLWSVMISLWSVFASVASCSVGGILAGVGFAYSGNAPTGIAMIGAAIICAGLAILLFFGCKAATQGILMLTKKIALKIKHCFIKKEVA